MFWHSGCVRNKVFELSILNGHGYIRDSIMKKPLWIPSRPEKSQMWQFIQFVAEQYTFSCPDYQALHTWSTEHTADFWQALCDFLHLTFDKPAKQILTTGQDMIDARWFSGASFNYAQKLLARRDDHPAIISINEQGQRQSLSYAALYQEVSQCVAALRAAGVQPGDRVAGIMPNVAFTIIAMLASASIGATWSSCSSDFGAQAIVDRLEQIQPKIVFICDGHRYNGKEYSAETKIHAILAKLPSLKQLVIYPNLSISLNIANTTALSDFLKPACEIEFASLPFDHPLYILFSSGTTGKPKCIMHGAGGTLLQHLKELVLHTDIRAEDNLLFYTTCGWMMWNWMVSTLALGATLTLYEGSPTHPRATHLFEIIDKEQVTHFGTGAKFLSLLEKEQIKPHDACEMRTLRVLLSTGSPLLPHQYAYVYQQIKADIQLSSISGGTDIVSCFALGNPILPVYEGELQCIGLGMDVQIYDDQGQSVQQTPGELVCTQPFPSMPIGFWHDPDKARYRSAYFEAFPGVWTHGDFAQITAQHGLIIYGRSDATLNPGGVRIGTAELYRQLETISDITDSVAIDQHYGDDTRIVLFVKLQPNQQLTEALKNTIRQTIRTNTSPRHVPAVIIQVPDIPRTINGKLVEIAVKQTVHGEVVKNLDSLANPESLVYFKNHAEL